MRFSNVAVLLPLIAFFLAGCDKSPAAAAPATAMPATAMPAAVKAAEPAPVAQPAVTMPVEIKDGGAPPADMRTVGVVLGVIPGDMLGDALSAPRHVIAASFGGQMAVKLDVLQREFGPHAKAANPGMLTGGLVIAPQDTRFLRVATFMLDQQTGGTMGGMFADAGGAPVALVYFDRACTMRGTIKGDGFSTEIDLQIPAAGMYWLEVEAGKDVDKVRNARPGVALKFVASK